MSAKPLTPLLGGKIMSTGFLTGHKCGKYLTLIQPSSAAAERVFSLLANSFGSKQENALGDYIKQFLRNIGKNYGVCLRALEKGSIG